MVVLDLNLVRNHGLGSRQSSYIGAGDSWSTTGTFKTQEDEDEKEEQARKDAVIKNATHLYLQSRSIHKISPSINKLINLKVIYLYDNKLVTIHALAHAVNLTHVYLQGNTISTTSGLSKLKKLEKLYLANNKIEVIEDLCNTDGEGSLQELHIENQELPAGMPLVFEPEALESLRFTIRIINISGNNIQTVDNILQTCHRTLQKIDASNNRITSLNTMSDDGGQVRFPYLKQIIFKNNPLQQKSGTKKYRQGLVTKFESLNELDGNEISAFERKWHLAFQEKEFNILHQQAQEKLAAAHEQQFQPMHSITDLIPPVPDHWRSRGLPGARHQFDQVLAKARANANERAHAEASAAELLASEQIIHKKSQLRDHIQTIQGHEQLGDVGAPFGLGIKTLDSEGDLRNVRKQQKQVTDNKGRPMKLVPMKLAPLDD